MTGPVPPDFVWHSFYAVINALPKVWPFRHLILEDFLHPALYAALTVEDYGRGLIQRPHPAHMTETAETQRHALQIHHPDDVADLGAPSLAQLWHTLTDSRLTELLIQKFADEIAKRHGTQRLPTTFGIEVIEDRTGYALKPHTDALRKLVTVLVYLAEPGADESLGTAIYAMNDPKAFAGSFPDGARFPREYLGLAKTVPYRPNTALIFAPGAHSFHGVEAVAAGTARRVIQFQINLDQGKAA